RPGVTVADYLTGVFAAEAALAALYRRDATPRRRAGGRSSSRDDGAHGTGAQGAGAVIDASLYGAVLRILEWTITAYDRLGTVRSREGNRLSNSAPLDNYPTADGRFVCVVAGSDANFGRLCEAMGRPDLRTDPRFASLADRARHGDTINAVVAEWTRARTAAEVEQACVRFDVPVATAYTAVEIASDAHFASRGDLIAIDDPILGAIRQQAPYPRLVGEQGTIPSGAPTLGADNVEVWCDMVGLTRAELDGLRDRGIV
ncbi:MAG TPA: CoA transferase, partial [Acidimicrobiales bacterium]|nr:CoA transferase [Acidimicrobiales bacterium]